MAKVCLGDVANERKENCKTDEYNNHIVGLEHLIPQEITLTQWAENVDNTFTKVFRRGDILFGRRRAYLKKAAVAPFDGICSGDITVIQAKPNKIVPDLLPFIIQNDDLFNYAVEKSAGSLSPRVKWTHLQNYEFELPNLNKQHELAELLWVAEETKQAYIKTIKCIDKIIESEFTKRFGGLLKSEKTSMTIEQLSILFCDGDWIEVKDQSLSGIRLIQTGNIGDGKFINKEEKARYINENTYNNLSCTEVCPGDILISRLPDPIGRACIIPNMNKKMITAVDCAIFQPKETLDKKFFVAFTLTNLYKNQIQKYETGSTRKRISRKNLGLIKIPIPDIQCQKDYADFADKCINTRFNLEQMVTNITNIQKILVKKLLTEVSDV